MDNIQFQQVLDDSNNEFTQLFESDDSFNKNKFLIIDTTIEEWDSIITINEDTFNIGYSKLLKDNFIKVGHTKTHSLEKLVNSMDASGNLHNYLKINQNGTLHKNLLILIDNFDLVCGKIVTKLEFSNLYKD